VPKSKPRSLGTSTGTGSTSSGDRFERGGGRGGVHTRKRSMTRWSGRWERSAIWAMRRSAESRVRESSEGGRIGPDLDLERLFIATLSSKQRRLPLAAVPRHVAALDPRPPHRTAPHARFVLRLPAGQRRSRAEGQGGRGGDDRDPCTYRRLFTAFSPSPPRFPTVFCLPLVGTLCLRDPKSGYFA